MRTECSGLAAYVAHLNATFLSTDRVRCPDNARSTYSLDVQFGKLAGGLGNPSVIVRAYQNRSSFLPENLAKRSGEHN